MRDVKVSVWGRSFDLPVRFDCYEGESVLPDQEEGLSALLSSWEVVEKAKESLIDYISDDDKAGIEAGSIENVFKYVIPDYLYIDRDQCKRTVALMCDYRFDLEHGIALVFENEELAKIGPQDIAL